MSEFCVFLSMSKFNFLFRLYESLQLHFNTMLYTWYVAEKYVSRIFDISHLYYEGMVAVIQRKLCVSAFFFGWRLNSIDVVIFLCAVANTLVMPYNIGIGNSRPLHMYRNVNSPCHCFAAKIGNSLLKWYMRSGNAAPQYSYSHSYEESMQGVPLRTNFEIQLEYFRIVMKTKIGKRIRHKKKNRALLIALCHVEMLFLNTPWNLQSDIVSH